MTPYSSAGYDADVAIIGHGPTGLVGALTPARKGVRVVAFERDEGLYARARAVTVNDWTMRIFQDLGIDERIEKVIEPQRALRRMTYDGHEVTAPVTAPVLDAEGRTGLAISVSGLVGRFRPETHVDAIRAAATGLANHLARRRIPPGAGPL